MLKAIIYNPYRILGVYSNSPKKEQIANKGKMQAFLRVNKSMPFPLDLKGILPEVTRTQDAVDTADSELALSSEQIKHAQFWFANKTPIDKIAFNHLLGGDMESAIKIWKKSVNMSSLQNLFVCYLIKEDYKTAIVDCAIPLYNNYGDAFVSMIDEKVSLPVSELAEKIVETLSEEDIDTTCISSNITDDIWKKNIESKRVNPLFAQLESHITEAKSTKNKGCIARLNAGDKLRIASKPLLSTLKSILPANDTRYQMIADKVSQEVLQCSIDYYNDTNEPDSPAKALPLCDYAKYIAEGNAAKQRCDENYDVIKKAFDNMPPAEVASEAKEITSIFDWYHNQKKTSANGLELLKKAQKPLISIKEKLGKNHKYYLETSSILGSAALSNVIDEVNEAQKEDKPNPLSGLFGGLNSSIYENILGVQERRRQKAYTLKAALASAWKTIVYIDLLDTTDSFKKNRYQPNRKTLYSIIDGLKGFDYPDDNHIIRGCAHGIRADSKFFWCDSELYAACRSKSDYQSYLQKFPSGNHIAEAQRRIEEITEHYKKMLKYGLIAIAIIILVIVVMCSANAMTTEKSSPARFVNSTEQAYYGNSDDESQDDSEDTYSSDYDSEDSEDEEENEFYDEFDNDNDNDDSYEY